MYSDIPRRQLFPVTLPSALIVGLLVGIQEPHLFVTSSLVILVAAGILNTLVNEVSVITHFFDQVKRSARKFVARLRVTCQGAAQTIQERLKDAGIQVLVGSKRVTELTVSGVHGTEQFLRTKHLHLFPKLKSISLLPAGPVNFREVLFIIALVTVAFAVNEVNPLKMSTQNRILLSTGIAAIPILTMRTTGFSLAILAWVVLTAWCGFRPADRTCMLRLRKHAPKGQKII
jgi:hypothetical protein